MKPHPAVKSQNEINAEWNVITHKRLEQIVSGRDLTYTGLLLPLMARLSAPYSAGASILDVGCGTGHLSALAAESAQEVVGVDPSEVAIRVSISLNRGHSNTSFHCQTIEDYSASAGRMFDMAFACMVLMDCLNLDAATQSIARVLSPGGVFVGVVVHPLFWPLYWDYYKETWFDYSKETVIEASFRISNEATDYLTTHVHRSLERYSAAFLNSGFGAVEWLEPPPRDGADAARFRFPRYLAFRTRRI